MTSPQDCQNFIEEAVNLFGRIDLLFLNAGIGAHSMFRDVKDTSVIKKVMETNFMGYAYLTKYALPYMSEESFQKPQIGVMSSVSGEMGLPLRSVYCASKFAVTGFFEALRIEEQGIDFTIISPSSISTSFRDNSLKSSESSVDIEQ